MITQELFQMALNITNPWMVNDIKFNSEDKKLDIYIDFTKGSIFSYEYVETKTETKKVTIDGKETEIKNDIEISRETFNDLKAASPQASFQPNLKVTLIKPTFSI